MPDGKAEPSARLNAAVPIPLNRILPPEPPGNEIDWAVVEGLVTGYLNRDPIPPITVYPVGNDQYRALFGQHRLAAAPRAGMTEILAIVLAAEPSAVEKAAIQWKENFGRKSLTTVEQAGLIVRALEADPTLNGKGVAKLFNVSEALVSKSLQVHRNLHDSLKELVAKLQMIPRAAYAVARLPQDVQVSFWDGHKDKKAEFIEDAVAEKLAVLAGTAPKTKPYTGATPGGVKFTIPAEFANDPARARAELVRLAQALGWLASKHLPFTDLDHYWRTHP